MMPTEPASSPDAHALLLDYLDYYRAVVRSKTEDLPDAVARLRRLPSDWSVIELVTHLVHMERRWVVWGLAGEQIRQPWGDHAGDEPGACWEASDHETLASLLDRLDEGGRRTHEIVGAMTLEQEGALGGRFPQEGQDGAPSVAWVLLHVLQEYARHAGHLDIVRELHDGTVGEA